MSRSVELFFPRGEILSVAQGIWKRFAPSNIETWDDEPHKAEYLNCAEAILSPYSWRDIETAPKDGTRLLLICASAYSPEARLGWWQEGWDWLGLMPGDDKHPGGITKWFPTHWMPLPAAPEVKP